MPMHTLHGILADGMFLMTDNLGVEQFEELLGVATS